MGKSMEKLTDPRTQYALAKAAQPSEGFVPRNFFSDVTLAGQEYDQLQAQKGTALEKNLEVLKEMMPERSTGDLVNLLLGKDRNAELASARLSLFNEMLRQNHPNLYVENEDGTQRRRSDAEILAIADSIVRQNFGLDPINDSPAISSQTGDIVLEPK